MVRIESGTLKGIMFVSSVWTYETLFPWENGKIMIGGQPRPKQSENASKTRADSNNLAIFTVTNGWLIHP